MTESRDPRIRAAMVELGSASREAPAWEQIEAASVVRPVPVSSAARSHRWAAGAGRLIGQWQRRRSGEALPAVVLGRFDMEKTESKMTTRKGLLIAAAALAAAMLVALPLLFLRGGDGSPVISSTETTQVATTTTVPPTTSTTTPAETTTPQAAALAWGRVPYDEAVFGGGATPHPGPEMNSVVAGGPGLVAVGYNSGAAAVWTSTDGVVWERAPYDEAVFGGGWQEMRAVVAGGPGLVAVGFDGRGEVVWTSADGVVWERGPLFGGSLRMQAVVAGGPGLVAVGFDSRGAAVWTSVDGLTWERVPYDEAVFGGSQEMRAVVVGGPGLVAVGCDFTGGSGSDDGAIAAVWTSADGLAWRRVSQDAVSGAVAGHCMNSVAVGGPGLVAVGYDHFVGYFQGRQAAAVWVSPPAG